MTMTPRVKESIKTALAMTIAYGIALSMKWNLPYWAVPADALCEWSTAKLEHLEGRIEETIDKAGEDEISDLDEEAFYRLLGAYRGFSGAVIEHADVAEGIEWERWRESRF
jgi:hypothetical protein